MFGKVQIYLVYHLGFLNFLVSFEYLYFRHYLFLGDIKVCQFTDYHP
jgi:hypothetical protein